MQIQDFWKIEGFWINPAEISYLRLTQTKTGPVLEVYLKNSVNFAFTNPEEINRLLGEGIPKRKMFSRPD